MVEGQQLVTVWVTPEMHREFKTKCFQNGRTISGVLRDGIEAYLDGKSAAGLAAIGADLIEGLDDWMNFTQQACPFCNTHFSHADDCVIGRLRTAIDGK